MSNTENENEVLSTNANGKRVNALELGPRKKSYVVLLALMSFQRTFISSKSDALVHHGRHFCRTIHAMCNIHALLTQSIVREVEETPDEELTAEYVIHHLLRLTLWLTIS